MSYNEPNLNPNAEEGESQCKSIEAYLKAGHTITSLESWKAIECGRLASRVNDLKNRDVPVLSVTVVREAYVDSNGRKHKKKKFSAYYIADGIKRVYSIKDDNDIPDIVKRVTEHRINQH